MHAAMSHLVLEHLKRFMTVHWWFVMINKTNKCIYKYVHVNSL